MWRVAAGAASPLARSVALSRAGRRPELPSRAAQCVRQFRPAPTALFRPSLARAHGDYEWEDPKSPEDVVPFTIIARDGSRHEVAGKVGDNLLYLMHRIAKSHKTLTLEVGAASHPHRSHMSQRGRSRASRLNSRVTAIQGACEASLACSTCHVIVDDEHYDSLPEPSEDEEDMLDEATGLTDSSRLGCQIILTHEQDGMEITLPAYSRNFYVDGHVPEPH